jgi:hypothetical protein
MYLKRSARPPASAASVTRAPHPVSPPFQIALSSEMMAARTFQRPREPAAAAYSRCRKEAASGKRQFDGDAGGAEPASCRVMDESDGSLWLPRFAFLVHRYARADLCLRAPRTTQRIGGQVRPPMRTRESSERMTTRQPLGRGW